MHLVIHNQGKYRAYRRNYGHSAWNHRFVLVLAAGTGESREPWV